MGLHTEASTPRQSSSACVTCSSRTEGTEGTKTASAILTQYCGGASDRLRFRREAGAAIGSGQAPPAPAAPCERSLA